MIIAGILSILGSSAFGTVLGGIFAILNKKTDLELKKMDYAHDLALRDKDIETAKAEAAGRKEVAIVEGDAAFDVARMNSMAIAQAADHVTASEILAAGSLGWMYVLADVFNKLIRPTATVILTGMAIYINYLLVDRLTTGWGGLSIQQQAEIGMQAFAWITGQGSAVLGYWFFSRKNK
jgi:hypothetical protein